MDSTSWLHGYINNATGNNGFMCGYAAGSSYTPEELQYREEEQQQFLISSQIQHHLNQISVRMNMEDDEEGASVYALSSNDAADWERVAPCRGFSLYGETDSDRMAKEVQMSEMSGEAISHMLAALAATWLAAGR